MKLPEHMERFREQVARSLAPPHRKHLYRNLLNEAEAMQARIDELEGALLAIGIQVVKATEKRT